MVQGTIIWYDKEKELGIAKTEKHSRVLISIYDVINSNFLLENDKIEMDILEGKYELPQGSNVRSQVSRLDPNIVFIFKGSFNE